MIKQQNHSIVHKMKIIVKRAVKAVYFPLRHAARKLYAPLIPLKNKVLFATFQGSYACNPKAIAEEIRRQKLPYQLVWVAYKRDMTGEARRQYPEDMIVVKRGSAAFFRHAASSKVWIDNALNMIYMQSPKKKNQVVFQTWHGSLGLKRINAQSMAGDQKWVRRAYRYAAETDYCISNSAFETGVFRQTYWKDTKILEYGHARNDILFQQSAGYEAEMRRLREKVYTYFGIDEDKKLLLYAPTYRPEEERMDFELDYPALQQALQERFGASFAVLVKFHYKERNYFDVGPHLQDVYNATAYPDIQDLICVSDVALTDYSSWIYDWVLTQKPGFLFVPDLDRYDQERGFYYRLDTTPFPICLTGEELLRKIQNFDQDKYECERIAFLEDKGCVEDGHAAQRIVEKIKEIMESESAS